MSALNDYFQSMANKMRSKTGKSALLTPSDMIMEVDEVYAAGQNDPLYGPKNIFNDRGVDQGLNSSDDPTLLFYMGNDIPIYGYYSTKAAYLKTENGTAVSLATLPAGFEDSIFIRLLMRLNSNQILISYSWTTNSSGISSPRYVRCITLKNDESTLLLGTALTLSGTPSATLYCHSELLVGGFYDFIQLWSNENTSTGAKTLTARRVYINWTTGALTADTSAYLVNVASNVNTFCPLFHGSSPFGASRYGFFYYNASDVPYAVIFGSYNTGNNRNLALSAFSSELNEIGVRDHIIIGKTSSGMWITAKRSLNADRKYVANIYLWLYDHTNTTNLLKLYSNVGIIDLEVGTAWGYIECVKNDTIYMGDGRRFLILVKEKRMVELPQLSKPLKWYAKAKLENMGPYSSFIDCTYMW